MTKRTYIYVILGLVVVALIDLIFPDHHHVSFPWHRWPAFDGALGFVGAIGLMVFSLKLGDLFLWQSTCSVALAQDAIGVENAEATVKECLVERQMIVSPNEPLIVLETDRGKRVIVSSPYGGRVAKIFVDPGTRVRVGETLVDVVVAKSEFAHNGGQEGSHA